MALEPIDVTTRGGEIEAAHLKVVKATDPSVSWLVLSPDQKRAYYPEFTGSGEFREFLENFVDGKVQYGLARVSPPGSDVQKLILVGWCPESSPLKAKASFAQNFGVVANSVLQGYHVQVTARDEDDLDEKELLMKISNAAGARYSIQTASRSTASSAPKKVASLPKPAVSGSRDLSSTPASSPKVTTEKPNQTKKTSSTPDDDWSEPELEERDLDSDPVKSQNSSWKPIGKVDLQKVIQEEKAREDPRLVAKTSIKHPEGPNAFTKQPVPTPMPKRNDDNIIKGFRNEKSPAQLWAEKKAKQAGASLPDSVASPHTKDATSEADEDSHDVDDLKSKFEQMDTSSTSEPVIIRQKQYSPKPVGDFPAPPLRNDYKKFGQPLPGMHSKEPDAKDEGDQVQDDWDDDEDDERTTAPPTLPKRDTAKDSEPASDIASDTPLDDSRESPILPNRDSKTDPVPPPPPTRKDTSEEQGSEDVSEAPSPSLPSREVASDSMPPPPPRRTTSHEEPKEKEAPSALAEYDYEAGEDNELTFEENDKIINIEFVDEDWWLGELEKNGEKGLFPSNYVSLIK